MSPSTLLEILACASLAIWLVLFFGWGGFWRVWEADADQQASRPAPDWPPVSAIVPARNEAASIASAVAALAKQDYPGEFSVIVVDDHSWDGTAELARHAALESGAAARVRILPAPPLEPGWTGKLWALNCGVAAALDGPAERPPGWPSKEPQFLWFTDADVVQHPATLAQMVSRAELGRLDLTSLMVLLESGNLAERLLLPAFLYFFLMLYPPRWIADPAAKTAGAAGGSVLLRRSALERIGRFSTIRNQVIDDCSLARVVKHSGGRINMGLTRESRSLRAYSGFAEIRDLIARTAFTQLGYSALALAGAVAGLLLTFLVPVVLTFHPRPFIWLPALLAWCLLTASFLPTITFYRLAPLWAPALPLAALFYIYATLLSAVRYWLGRGGQWKGRAQANPDLTKNRAA
jgi:hopene-associated glycosyltransferase HpnB